MLHEEEEVGNGSRSREEDAGNTMDRLDTAERNGDSDATRKFAGVGRIVVGD